METFRLPLGRVNWLEWPEPACVVFAYVWDGYLYGARRTHPDESESCIEKEAAAMKREHLAAKRLDKERAKLP